jgi:hypothetical protein
MFAMPAPSGLMGGGGSQQFSYPDLPSELQSPQTPQRPQQHPQTQQQQQQVQTVPAVPVVPVVQPPPKATTDNMAPVQRAARTILETLEGEKRYPQLDDTVARMLSPPPRETRVRRLLYGSKECCRIGWG